MAEANWRISGKWPEEYWVDDQLLGGYVISISIVTEIPREGIQDSGYVDTTYPDHQYQNDL